MRVNDIDIIIIDVTFEELWIMIDICMLLPLDGIIISIPAPHRARLSQRLSNKIRRRPQGAKLPQIKRGKINMHYTPTLRFNGYKMPFPQIDMSLHTDKARHLKFAYIFPYRFACHYFFEWGRASEINYRCVSYLRRVYFYRLTIVPHGASLHLASSLLNTTRNNLVADILKLVASRSVSNAISHRAGNMDIIIYILIPF